MRFFKILTLSLVIWVLTQIAPGVLHGQALSIILQLGCAIPLAVEDETRLAIESSPAVATENWKSFRGNPQHTGFAGALPPPVTVYVGSDARALHAIDLETCKEKWRYRVNGRVRSSPAVIVSNVGADKKAIIYVGTDSGTLYAIVDEGNRGRESWSFTPSPKRIGETIGAIRSSPAVDSAGNIYFGTDDGHLFSLKGDGTLQWRFPAMPSKPEDPDIRLGAFRSSPVIDEIRKTVYIASLDRWLYAVETAGERIGRQKWKQFLNGPVVSSPALDRDGNIYVVTDVGKLYGFNENAGEFLSPSLDRDVFSSPAIDKDGNIYLGAEDGTLHVVRPSGSVRCRTTKTDTNKIERSVRTSPALMTDTNANETVMAAFVGSDDGKIFAISPQDCFARGASKSDGISGSVRSSLVLIRDQKDANKGKIVFGAADGSFYVFNFQINR